MALEKSPECKKEISSQAKSCPHCGFSPKKRGGCLLNILIAVSAALICLYVIGRVATSNTELENQPTSYDALRYAQNKIKEKLKSPSTAKFPNYSEKKGHVTGNGSEYEIDSWVDSQNGFGAIIRTRYKCKVIYEGDYVRIVDLKIN